MPAIAWRSVTGNLAVKILMGLMVCLTAVGQSSSPSLVSADAAMAAGRFEDAVREYEPWLRTHPESREVLLALGICYVQLGRQNEAIPLLRRYLKLVPKSAAGHAVLGIALIDAANTFEAKKELETAVRLNPKQADAAEVLARIYLMEGQAGKAVTLLRPLATTNDEARALLADALIRVGQVRHAGEMLERQLQANPQSPPRIYAMAAWAHFKAGSNSKVAEICEQGMRLYPDSEIEAVYLMLPAPFLAERIGVRIKSLQETPDAAELIAVGRALIDADPGNKTRANEIALRVLAHAIQLAPDSASAHYNYGRALSRTSLESALKKWDEALALNPKGELRLQILTKIAAAKLDLSDFDGAEQSFREALAINRKLQKRNPEAMLEYVRFLQLKSRPEEAEALLNEVLSVNPLSPRAHLERAKLLAARAQWDRVVSAGEFVLRNAESDTELLRAAHMLLARAYLRLNQPDKARKHRSWIELH